MSFPSSPPRPFVIGVTGGTASGKTTVCDSIVKQLGLSSPRVVMLSMDRFYRSLTAEELKFPADHNFDHPDAFDFDLFKDTLRRLIEAGSNCWLEVPQYSFKTHQRLSESEKIPTGDVVIIEGILTLHVKEIRDMMDMKIYVDADDDVRLARRIGRDIKERGRGVDDILHQYQRTVKPSHDDYIAPTKKFADIIIPRGGDNYVAIDLLVEHIHKQLEKRGVIAQSKSYTCSKCGYNYEGTKANL